MARKKYQVLSPDGFTIDFHKPYYTSQKKAIEAFEEWKKGYKKQGYYSSSPFGRIDLRDLHEYCTFKTI